MFERLKISIHALCEEGDRLPPQLPPHPQNFYPRPLRGGRLPSRSISLNDYIFLSTPSARRATPHYEAKTMQWFNFYPRPLRGGRPTKKSRKQREQRISIHALCEEGDQQTDSYMV